MIICKTPFRISFFGGGTDMPKWFNKNEGQVINATINKYGYIYFTEKDDIYDYKFKIRYYLNEEATSLKKIKHPVVKSCLNYYNLSKKTLHVTYDSDLPARSGLGSSSSFTTGLVNAINAYKKVYLSKRRLAEKVIFIEHKILRETVGYQDQIAASYGGLNQIIFKKKKFFVNKINLSKKKLYDLNESLLLCFTNQQRFASNLEIIKNKNMYKNESIYHKINDITVEGMKLINGKNQYWLKDFGKLINQYWSLKKSLDRNVSNYKINEIYDNFIKEGIYGGKLMGAGNGGFFLIIAPKSVQKKIIKKYSNLKFVKVNIEEFGSKIVYD